MDSLKILIVFACGFVIAQILKAIIGFASGEKMPKGIGNKIAYLGRSGGMPSGHAASFVGATTLIGLIEGFGSTIFALAVCIALIVLYDAINVRYAVGEQGKILQKIVRNSGLQNQKMRLIEGHTVSQILVGALLGIAIALIFWLVF